jgi:hypothetical protein
VTCDAQSGGREKQLMLSSSLLSRVAPKTPRTCLKFHSYLFFERPAQPHTATEMLSCSELVTSPQISSRFQRRLPGGRYDLIFKVAFGSDAAAARSLGRSKMQIWRYRHGQSPVPKWITDVLVLLVQKKVEQACAARQELNYFRQLPPKPPRPLTGCCARYR